MEVESQLAYIYMLSAFRNAISTTIISCGRNETWSQDLLLQLNTAANGGWFWYLWLSYKLFCLTQVTIGVRGNVVLLGRPSNCKRWEGLASVGGSPACTCSSMESQIESLDRERRRRSRHDNVDLRRSERIAASQRRLEESSEQR